MLHHPNTVRIINTRKKTYHHLTTFPPHPTRTSNQQPGNNPSPSSSRIYIKTKIQKKRK